MKVKISSVAEIWEVKTNNDKTPVKGVVMLTVCKMVIPTAVSRAAVVSALLHPI